MTDEGERLNKAERLAVAAAVAPSLRRADERTRQRRIARVDAEGKVTGYTTLGAVQDALLAKHAIEIDVQPGVRAKEIICETCGIPVKVPPKAKGLTTERQIKWCAECDPASQKTCAGYPGGPQCNKKPPKWAFKPRRIANRGGSKWCCFQCMNSSPEFQARRQASIRAAQARPEARANMSAAQRRISADPQVRAKRAIGLSKAWDKDPERRARQAEHARRHASKTLVKARAAKAGKAAAERKRNVTDTDQPNPRKIVTTMKTCKTALRTLIDTLPNGFGDTPLETYHDAVETALTAAIAAFTDGIMTALGQDDAIHDILSDEDDHVAAVTYWNEVDNWSEPDGDDSADVVAMVDARVRDLNFDEGYADAVDELSDDAAAVEAFVDDFCDGDTSAVDGSVAA